MDTHDFFQRMGKEKEGRYDPDWVVGIKDRQREAILKFLKIVEPRRVLDVGCGTGRYLLKLARQGYDVVGVDFSSEMLRVAQKNISGQKRKIKLLQADVRKLPKNLSNFDAVIFVDTLHHFITPADREVAIRNVCGAVRKGGYLVIDVKNLHNPFFFIQQKFVYPFVGRKELAASYSVNEIKRVAGRFGCVLMKTVPSVIPLTLVDPLVTCLFKKT